MTKNTVDPRGLIKDSYLIEGISAPECRSIFLDWALWGSQDLDVKDKIQALLDKYSPDFPDHPMTAVLKDGLQTAPKSQRRGGRGARLGY